MEKPENVLLWHLFLGSSHSGEVRNCAPMSKSVSPKVCISRVGKMVANNLNQCVAIFSLHSLDDLSMIALDFL